MNAKVMHYNELKPGLTESEARAAGFIVIYETPTTPCLNCGKKNLGKSKFCDESCHLDYSEI